jgi:hypothetical protein
MDAYESLSRADERAPLAAVDLELLATSAYMRGLNDEYQSALERAHHAHLEVGEALRAVRCAFWLGADLALRGEMGPATGWFGRARRLLEREQRDCVEHGYLLLPVVLQQVAAGAWETAYAAAVDGARVGERFGDADLLALALQEQGRALIKQGRVEEGLGLLDEASDMRAIGDMRLGWRRARARGRPLALAGTAPRLDAERALAPRSFVVRDRRRGPSAPF